MLVNAAGQQVLDGVTSAAQFRGPPLVAVGDLAGARFDHLLGIAPTLSDQTKTACPVIALAVGESPAALDYGLRQLTRFFDSTTLRPFVWSDGVRVLTPLPCGPILAYQAADDDVATLRAAWDLSTRYCRTTQQHRFRHGMLAVGAESVPGLFGPPVYKIRASTWQGDVDSLMQVWRNGGASAESQVTALIDAETGPPARPGFRRRVAPYLVPHLLLRRP